MSGPVAAATATQLAGVALAPLVPGTVQSAKARLQGRVGTSPLQPYRSLRRLWSRSAVDPLGTGIVYRLAPAVVVACLLVAFAVVPVLTASGPWGVGHDALALLGLLALARMTLALASWDTGNGFALMGVARDLMIAVFAEGLLALALLLAALLPASTDLTAMSAAAAGGAIWQQVAHWCALAAFALVVLVETGRQPIDNPDTHLELTMIHEGPLLEYAGRDLALLQWAAAARHWLVLLLAVDLFLPRWGGFWAQLAQLAGWLLVCALALAVVETLQAKMRLLRVPALLGLGALIALGGVAAWTAGAAL